MPHLQTHASLNSVYELIVRFTENVSFSFEENCEKRKYKCVTPKIKDTNQIVSFYSTGCFVNVALMVKKEKMDLTQTAYFVGIQIKLGLRNDKTEH